MADPMTMMMVASTVMTAVGGVQQASAAREAGNAANQEAQYEAAQLKENGIQEVAASQRTAENTQRQKQLAESKGRAVAAAGGGDSLDPSVVKLMGDLETQGSYNAQADLYKGKAAQVQDLNMASGKTYSGQQAKIAGNMRANSILLNTGSSLLSKYAPSASPFDDGGGSIPSNVFTDQTYDPASNTLMTNY